MMNPRKTSEMTSLSFQSASATRTTPPATSVTTRAFRAVCASTQGFSRPPPNAANPMWSSQRERVCLEERLHPVLLASSFARALGLAGLGALLSQLGWFLAPDRAGGGGGAGAGGRCGLDPAGRPRRGCGLRASETAAAGRRDGRWGRSPRAGRAVSQRVSGDCPPATAAVSPLTAGGGCPHHR